MRGESGEWGASRWRGERRCYTGGMKLAHDPATRDWSICVEDDVPALLPSLRALLAEA